MRYITYTRVVPANVAFEFSVAVRGVLFDLGISVFFGCERCDVRNAVQIYGACAVWCLLSVVLCRFYGLWEVYYQNMIWDRKCSFTIRITDSACVSATFS